MYAVLSEAGVCSGGTYLSFILGYFLFDWLLRSVCMDFDDVSLPWVGGWGGLYIAWSRSSRPSPLLSLSPFLSDIHPLCYGVWEAGCTGEREGYYEAATLFHHEHCGPRFCVTWLRDECGGKVLRCKKCTQGAGGWEVEVCGLHCL